jgi:hypothetical protein
MKAKRQFEILLNKIVETGDNIELDSQYSDICSRHIDIRQQRSFVVQTALCRWMDYQQRTERGYRFWHSFIKAYDRLENGHLSLIRKWLLALRRCDSGIVNRWS